MTRRVDTPLSVVLIEDDPGHASLIRRNLHRAGATYEIVHLQTGTDAIDHFFAKTDSAGSTDFTVVVLDLNLPDIDGFEILRRLKEDPITRKIPVIVLTTTDNPSDVDRCYALGCNVFMTKPVGYEDFSEAIRKLGIWLSDVRTPHDHD